MESLYFDALQFVYHLSLAVLVGGAIVLDRPSRRYDRFAGLALLGLVIATVLKAFAFEDTDVGPRLVARWVALAVLIVATLYAGAWAAPVASAYRRQSPDLDALSPTSGERLELAALERSALRALRVGALAGLVALFLS